MWYVIQVTTGREQEVAEVIRRELPGNLYERCFYIKRERIWRRDEKYILHRETMFPGYLFISTNHPKDVYLKLKSIPKFTRFLKNEEEAFLAVNPDEKEFLENLLDGDEEDTVRLSEVRVDEDKEIISANGPLRHYRKKIVKKKLRLRYVMIETELFGKVRTVLIGIRLGGDELETE